MGFINPGRWNIRKETRALETSGDGTSDKETRAQAYLFLYRIFNLPRFINMIFQMGRLINSVEQLFPRRGGRRWGRGQ